MIAAISTSAIRTASAYLVAWLLSLKLAGPVLQFCGVDSATAKQRLTALLVFVLGTVYYVAVRALEERWPAAGSLLGIPTRPRYAPVISTDMPLSTDTGRIAVHVHAAAPPLSTPLPADGSDIGPAPDVSDLAPQ